MGDCPSGTRAGPHLGVRNGRHQLSLFGKYIVAPLALRNVVADHEAKERLIKQSKLNWTIVRAPIVHKSINGTKRTCKPR